MPKGVPVRRLPLGSGPSGKARERIEISALLSENGRKMIRFQAATEAVSAADSKQSREGGALPGRARSRGGMRGARNDQNLRALKEKWPESDWIWGEALNTWLAPPSVPR